MIGDLVREARRSAGLTQVELAKLAGLSQNYISKLESGEIDLPQRGTLEALGKPLGLTLADFYREAKILDWPQQQEIEPAILAETLAWIEQQPGLMAEFKRMGETHSPDVVRRAKINLARAWAANMRMLLDSMALGGEY